MRCSDRLRPSSSIGQGWLTTVGRGVLSFTGRKFGASVARAHRLGVRHPFGGWQLRLLAKKLFGVAKDVRRCDMSLLQHIMDGSLVSRQRLMQSREFYSPTER